jgi:hypothetical protein
MAKVKPISFDCQYRLGQGHGHHAIIGEKTIASEKLELLAPMVIPFKSRTNYIANYRSQHNLILLLVGQD